MAAIEFELNGKPTKVDADPAMPVLWLVRDVLNMTGTKYGCGIAACGACTVLVDGVATRTCVLPADSIRGKKITTIEGLAASHSTTAGALHPVQQAWIDEQVPQCGYCQSGMVLAAASLLKQTPNPSDEQIDASMTNLCRCGTYQRVRVAVKRAAQQMVGSSMPASKAAPKPAPTPASKPTAKGAV